MASNQNIAYVAITGQFGNGAAPQVTIAFSFTIVPPGGMSSSGLYGGTAGAAYSYGDSNEDIRKAIEAAIGAEVASNPGWPVPDSYQFITG